jgi:hypothetical protein
MGDIFNRQKQHFRTYERPIDGRSMPEPRRAVCVAYLSTRISEIAVSTPEATLGRGGRIHQDSAMRTFRDPDGEFLNRWDHLGLDSVG